MDSERNRGQQVGSLAILKLLPDRSIIKGLVEGETDANPSKRHERYQSLSEDEKKRVDDQIADISESFGSGGP
jgi:hypothetical protein